MRETAEHSSYSGLRAVLLCHCLTSACRTSCRHTPEHVGRIRGAHLGFTLVEVVVALSVFVIVVLALTANYYGFYASYASAQNERYRTLAENLAQLQLEDIQGLPVSVLTSMVGETSAEGLGYYPY